MDRLVMPSELILHHGYMVWPKDAPTWVWAIYYGTYFWDEKTEKKVKDPTEWWCHERPKWIKYN